MSADRIPDPDTFLPRMGAVCPADPDGRPDPRSRAQLLRWARARPQDVRVVSVERGPWRRWPGAARAPAAGRIHPGPDGAAAEEGAPPPWLVSCRPRPASPGGPVGEPVRWLGLCLDGRSAARVCRWVRAARESLRWGSKLA